MPRFADALKVLAESMPDQGEETWADISSAYDEDLGEATTGASAYATELEEKLAAVQAELVQAQADNYKLLRSSGTEEEPPTESSDGDETTDEEPDDFGDDYFEKDED